jgi:hypothetical protein
MHGKDGRTANDAKNAWQRKMHDKRNRRRTAKKARTKNKTEAHDKETTHGKGFLCRALLKKRTAKIAVIQTVGSRFCWTAEIDNHLDR